MKLNQAEIHDDFTKVLNRYKQRIDFDYGGKTIY